MRFIIVERYADNGELSHRALIDTTDGREVGTDGGEPEDASFWRDWAWVPDELNKHDAALQRAKAEVWREVIEGATSLRASVENGIPPHERAGFMRACNEIIGYARATQIEEGE